MSYTSTKFRESEEIEDPISGIDPDTKEIRVILSGDLPWDRYYGNYVYVKLKDRVSLNNPPQLVYN